MKNLSKILIVIVVLSLCLTVFCACGQPTAGLSAYEIAVKNGYIGTETEWLKSLKGADSGKSAYEIAVENGFKGSETEWLQSLKGADGLNGIDGLNGKDAPQVTITEIYDALVAQGYTGTFSDFVKDYLSNTTLNQTEAYVSKAVLSCVSIISTFTKQEYTSSGSWWTPGTTTNKDYQAGGSGVIYKLDKDNGSAYVITNYHVVYDSSSITTNGIAKEIDVYLYGKEIEGSEIRATYVGGSMTYDIAVLRIQNSTILKNSEARAVDIFDSNDIVIGETAIAIGNPQSDGIAVTSGVISVDSETINMTAADSYTNVSFRVMRIDTAVNPGNSGGGLFNAYGELIGIVNAKMTVSGVENIAYAIPSNITRYVADNIIANCNGTTSLCVKKCMLGITLERADSYAHYDALTQRTKVIETIKVASVDNTSLTYGILEVGDILKSITIGNKNYEITRIFIPVDIMLTARINDTITLNFERNGVEMSKNIVLTEKSITQVK